MPDQDKEAKTIKATVRKRRDAAKKGTLPRSREVSNVATFCVAVLVLFVFGEQASKGLSDIMRKVFGVTGVMQVNPTSVETLFWELAGDAATIVLPLFLALFVTAVVASIAFQGGWNISFQPFTFQPGKFNPIKGLKNIMGSTRALMNVLKSILLIAIISYIAVDTYVAELGNFRSLMMAHIPAALGYTFTVIFIALFKIMLLFIIVAVIDLVWTKYKYEQDLKMTIEEFKDERKTTEGNPLIKRRIRTLQYQLFRKRMMAAVPKADVVITNPSHYAVALSYDAGKSIAPEVVAKGRGYLALKIKEIARQSDVPIVENPPLAQALYRSCEVGGLIPPDLYRAIAEVLAYVYKLKNKVPA